MSTLRSSHSGELVPVTSRISQSSVLLVGLGGLGCPAAIALVEAGIGRLVLCDDDRVDEGNLHRQILFTASDIGQEKTTAALRRLQPRAQRSGTQLEVQHTRLLPSTASALVRSVDLTVEGADNFATKFLAADACYLERRPIVHGAAIRWHGTAWAVSASAKPCYRCLFEDIPEGQHANCESEGVMGPLVGFVGAMMAELALRSLQGRECEGKLWTYDGLKDRFREVSVRPRAECPLCGERASIAEVRESRYVSKRSADERPEERHPLSIERLSIDP